MAKATAVWGIEIGQAAFKALRCSIKDDQIIADAFDYVEYPKILSQPEADPEELVDAAIKKFLDRNDCSGDIKLVISVPGQSGLAKFFKPPPVETKKIPDIVKYEAKQQIPFDLDDVVWDFQVMPGSLIEDGYAMESEVGLFAMKSEQAYRQLQPFEKAGLEVDLIQMAPLALYNMLAYDRMNQRLESETFNSDSPPASSVLLSLGTESSDLIISNGFRIWQRSMPIGGNHFTRQLTKDLKLTFAKAEHMKRNARDAEDPKLIFQTMRPVFNDLVTELQRSIGFFKNLHKQSEISELLITGNAIKMPGFAQYLGKNLGYPVHVIDQFNRLEGENVLSIPSFRDNVQTFGVCYGLALQGLGQSQIKTSLTPREILVTRMIREKKPWVLAAVAALLLGMVGHYVLFERSWEKTHPDSWRTATTKVANTKSYSANHVDKFEQLEARLVYLKSIGTEVSGNLERRLLWMEMQKAIMAMVPKGNYPGGILPSPKDKPFDEREDVYIQNLDTRYYEDLATWFDKNRAAKYKSEIRSWAKLTNNPLPDGFGEKKKLKGPSGPGWVIELQGYHDHNGSKQKGREGNNHIRLTLTHNFLTKKVELPDVDGKVHRFSMEELGFQFPFLVSDKPPKFEKVPNPDYIAPVEGNNDRTSSKRLLGRSDPFNAPPTYPTERSLRPTDNEPIDSKNPKTLRVLRQKFIYQVCWVETPISERLERQRLAAEAKAAEAAKAAKNAS